MYGAAHLGVPVSSADTRSRGMGGVSMAISGEDFSFGNPARTVNFWRAGFNAAISQDYRNVKDANGSSSLRATNFLSFRGIFPTYKGYVVSFGVYQWRDLDWDFSDQVSVDILPNDIKRTLSSNGGIYVSRLAVAKAVNAHLAFGLGLDWSFGRAKQLRTLDFQNTDYHSNQESYDFRYSFFRPTLGVLTSYKGTNLGFSVTTSKSAQIRERINFYNGYQDRRKAALKYPASWRLGIARRLSQRSVLAADVEYEGWQSGDLILDSPFTAANQLRYGIGFELLPSAAENPPGYRKFPLRAGFSHATYPFRIAGASVVENTFSLGTGKYYGRGNGMADIAFEYLKRSTAAAGYPEESVFRIVFSLSAFEKWTARPRR
ncbi:MAG: hypothetical protein A3F83_04530 [Candidatus Glassbacteria bacterium RIFCSPLOWO2_12_FULL_58_11]|uniref:DUF5723 domain-containing protein n=2 Tax=Candidatus Glassiibacteriota TaxID=1817805 RepID=A0A1F5YW68_9BACT|nr:MAG: hypothetical protein A2Z86_08925 [Candidatus Glassbacteria bacterium GWA2_58_10]OGG04439.1 MAG: hypothetical protein A3F83_04530 [Candidatus Glassbacteria bacterium RIFCSPLOWO2_12_FULL_58_11]